MKKDKTRRISPDKIFSGMPCSVTAVGCALDIHDRNEAKKLLSPELHKDGYLSLSGMNHLACANLNVKRFYKYKRGERPQLWKYAQDHDNPAIICVYGHFLYYDGMNYHSFFNNYNGEVVAVWELNKED